MKHFPLILALAAVLPALAYNQQASKTDLATRQARPATFTSSYQHKPAVQAPARQWPERRHKAGIALRDALTGQLPAASSQRGDAKQRRAGAAESPRVVMAPGAAGAASFRGRMHIATGATLDEHGIIIAPAEGERKVYQRSGSSYINTDGLHTVDQSGQVQIVECEDGAYYIPDTSTDSTASNEVVTDANGMIYFRGLDTDKTYSLTETETLDGFNMLSEIVTLTLKEDKITTVTGTDGTSTNTVDFETDKALEWKQEVVESTNYAYPWAKVENLKGTLLPSTGGIGTTIFYIVGGILAVGAAVVLVARKRVSK